MKKKRKAATALLMLGGRTPGLRLMVLETAQILRCRGVGRAADERRERADGRRPFSVCTNSCDGPASETLHLSRHSGKTREPAGSAGKPPFLPEFCARRGALFTCRLDEHPRCARAHAGTPLADDGCADGVIAERLALEKSLTGSPDGLG